jgi:hypothetical protein
MTPQPTLSKPRLFASKRAAGAALGIPARALKEAQDKGCSAFKAGGQVAEAELKAWFESNPVKSIARGELSDYKLRIAREDWRRRVRDRRAAEAELVDARKVAGAWARVAAEQKTYLRQKLENELPVELAGLDAIACRQKLKAVVDQICGMMERIE